MKLRTLLLTTALFVAVPAGAQDLPPATAPAARIPSFDGNFRMYLPWSSLKKGRCVITIAADEISGSCATVYAGRTCTQAVSGAVSGAEYIQNIFGGYDAYGEVAIALTATNENCGGIPTAFAGPEYILANQAYPATPSTYRLAPRPQGNLTRE